MSVHNTAARRGECSARTGLRQARSNLHGADMADRLPEGDAVCSNRTFRACVRAPQRMAASGGGGIACVQDVASPGRIHPLPCGSGGSPPLRVRANEHGVPRPLDKWVCMIARLSQYDAPMPVLAAMMRKLSSSTGTALSSSLKCAPARRTPATTRFLPPFIASRFNHRMQRKPLRELRVSRTAQTPADL